MIPSLFLLSTVVFSNPVIISQVKAIREAGHLRVEVIGDGGIDPEGARTVLDEGRLFIYLGGTHVKADNRAWNLEDGAGEIRAHRHRTETELVVPLAGNGCTGPVELAGSSKGITALVGCDGAVPPPKAAQPVARAKTKIDSLTDAQKLKALVGLEPVPAGAAAAVAADRVRADAVAAAKAVAASTEKVKDNEKTSQKAQDDATPTPKSKAKVKANTTAETEAEIAAVVALPPSAAGSAPSHEAETSPTAAVAPPAVAPIVVPIAALPRVSAPPADRVASASTPTTAPTPAPTPVATTAVSLPLGTSAMGGAKAAGAGLGAVAVPALLLLALAIAAYLFARRRRGSLPRHIQILETATLGPKRSLVVARIGNQTLILGSSEAGITLLKASSSTDGMSVSEVAAAAAAAADLEAAAGTVDGASFPGVLAVSSSTGFVPAKEKEIGVSDEQAVMDSNDELSQPIQEALADIPEPDHGRGGSAGRNGLRTIEGGLGSFFARRTPDADAKRDGASDQFDELLEDSIEDQELRRKLAAGISARVR